MEKRRRRTAGGPPRNESTAPRVYGDPSAPLPMYGLEDAPRYYDSADPLPYTGEEGEQTESRDRFPRHASHAGNAEYSFSVPRYTQPRQRTQVPEADAGAYDAASAIDSPEPMDSMDTINTIDEINAVDVPRSQQRQISTTPHIELRGNYRDDSTSPTPVRNYGDAASLNPAPPRKWPLYLSVSLTVLLVFIALNVEQNREDAAHWAAPQASGINSSLIARSSMDTPGTLPTAVPQSYLEELEAAFALTGELPTNTPLVTSPPVTSVPLPTKAPLLKKDMQNDYILQVETRLSELGYLAAEDIDGKYDSKTVAAVRTFQEYNSLGIDGMAGEDTQELLFHERALSAPTPTPAPTRKNEPYVWATKNGKYFHSRKDCSNMKGAEEIAVSDAKAAGKKPCPECDPPTQ